MPSVPYIAGNGASRERATISGAGTTASPDVMQFESTGIGAITDAASNSGNVSLVALMKGLNASIGTTSDAAATTDTGTFSLISLTKRLLTETTAIPSMLFVTGTVTTATTTAIIAAPGAGLSIYVSFLRVELEGTTAQTITVRDGSSNRIRLFLATQGSNKDISLSANREFKLTVNTALNVVSAAASAFNYTIGYFIL